MAYSIRTITPNEKDGITLHKNIEGYAVAEYLYQDIVQAAKDRGRIVRYDFETLKGNRKPIAMRAIVTADRPNGASYYIDLLLNQ